ncbi:DsrE family protein [Cryobacterium sp. PH31-AA6]|uniref:DsrE family protein n=1 Tax=Cryobacterium sp. PH31-AA6 TaxID=3046205 RepID=UPI0024BBC9E1|nr:DsrE family protein [Cryobacterium sp. PH31-AA6]MDJ0322658.1 DsrE family protein [Cryobacterium sp. PH31-AA6]
MNNTGLLLHVSGADAIHIQAGIRAAINARAQLPTVSIELVIQGPCVTFLATGSVLESELAALGDGLVHILACNNSMRSAGLQADQLPGAVSVVPAAVAHLAARQFTGWAYVRV